MLMLHVSYDPILYLLVPWGRLLLWELLGRAEVRLRSHLDILSDHMSLALELVLALAAVPCVVGSCMSVVAGLDSNYLVAAVQVMEVDIAMEAHNIATGEMLEAD
jgi:hypothetical protein